MSLSYTYWPAENGGYVGYWNDYPDYMTEGATLEEFQRMLRSLRADIVEMLRDGTISDAPRLVAEMEYA